MNTPVNPELAKLLAEKKIRIKCLSVLSYEEAYYLHPTIAEVVMWLYEKHGIWICIDKAEDFNWWKFNIRKLNDIGYERIGFGSELNSPKEAYEAGIIYTLKNLI